MSELLFITAMAMAIIIEGIIVAFGISQSGNKKIWCEVAPGEWSYIEQVSEEGLNEIIERKNKIEGSYYAKSGQAFISLLVEFHGTTQILDYKEHNTESACISYLKNASRIDLCPCCDGTGIIEDNDCEQSCNTCYGTGKFYNWWRVRGERKLVS